MSNDKVVKQTGDKGISGVTVDLIQDGKVIATAVTG